MRLFLVDFFVPPLFLDLESLSSSSSTKPQTRFGVPSKGITQTKTDLVDELLFLLFLELLLLLVELFLSCRWRSLLLLLDDFFFFLELDFFLLVVSSTTKPQTTFGVLEVPGPITVVTQTTVGVLGSPLDDEEDGEVEDDELFFFFFLVGLLLLLSPGRSFGDRGVKIPLKDWQQSTDTICVKIECQVTIMLIESKVVCHLNSNYLPAVFASNTRRRIEPIFHIS